MRINLLGVEIDDYNNEETINQVEEYIVQKKALHLMGVNADKINYCCENPSFLELVNNCEVINPDGTSAVLASKFLKTPLPERIAGIDLMQDLLFLAENKGYSVYFVGSKENVIQDLISKIKANYPSLNISGYRNGYFSENEWDSVFDSINSTRPDIVFVGITSPLKEYIVEEFISLGGKSVYMGVGGSFDVLSGNLKRAPKWVQKIHFEWFYRMIQEPSRLVKRYFVGNTKFIFRIIRQKIRGV